MKLKIGPLLNSIKAGVVQGSVLGPILFILFILVINKYFPPGTNIKKYADDILAYVIGKHMLNLPQQIADGVEKWCNENKMLLNDSKCKVLYIDNDPNTAPPHVTLNNKQLKVVDNYKYLGIDINTQLDPTDQWQRVQKIGPAQYLLKQLKLDGFKEEILVTRSPSN